MRERARERRVREMGGGETGEKKRERRERERAGEVTGTVSR